MEPTCALNVNTVQIMPNGKQKTTDDRKNESTKNEVSKSKSLIKRLKERLPEIDRFFAVHKKIGEGTFSNVFVASSKVFSEKKKFAIKHLTPTSHPMRITQEMKCLKDIGGQDNVVGLELCFRNRDAVAFVMPYFPHDSFSSYVAQMSPKEIRSYMKNLLVALQRVHSFNIIHRDVKPSNFLYNRKEQKFLLVDFGLSHHVDNVLNNNINDATVIIKTDRKRVHDPFEKDTSSIESKRPVLHSLSNNVLDKKGDRQGMKSSVKKKSPLFKENSPMSKNRSIARNIGQVKRNLQFGNITAEAKKDFFPLLNEKFSQSLSSESTVFNRMGSSFFRIQNSQIKSQFSIGAGSSMRSNTMFRKPLTKSHQHLSKECGCDSKPRICNNCITRQAMHAPRAGTPGYRSPEVLLKYPHQTTAVDIWSAGVIMLSLLSGSFPFFRAPDDISALMEMITIFGTEELKNTAKKLGRNLLCNEIRKPLSLSKLCERLRRRTSAEVDDYVQFPSCSTCFQKILPAEGCICSETIHKNGASNDDIPEKFRSQVFPPEAYDLLSKLLTVDPDKRYTATLALSHPFFSLNLDSTDY